MQSVKPRWATHTGYIQEQAKTTLLIQPILYTTFNLLSFHTWLEIYILHHGLLINSRQISVML